MVWASTVRVASHGHDPGLERGCGREALQPLGIDQDERCTAVDEGVVQFVGLPPGIEGNHDRSDGGDGDVAGDPLRVVPHGDRHPVALADTEFVHHGMAGLGEHVGHGPSFGRLAVVDDELVGTGCGGRVESPNVRGSAGEYLGRLTPHLGLDDLERSARGADRDAGVGETHVRPQIVTATSTRRSPIVLASITTRVLIPAGETSSSGGTARRNP